MFIGIWLYLQSIQLNLTYPMYTQMSNELIQLLQVLRSVSYGTNALAPVLLLFSFHLSLSISLPLSLTLQTFLISVISSLLSLSPYLCLSLSLSFAFSIYISISIFLSPNRNRFTGCSFRTSAFAIASIIISLSNIDSDSALH